MSVGYNFPKLGSARRESTSASIDYKSGASFVGTVENNKKTGRGVFVWPSGDTYEGDYVDNVRSGNGVQQWADGSSYSGEFTADMRHGKGEHIWANGEKYSGQFFKDRRHGMGTYTWPDGSSYTGTFYIDKKEGYGKFMFANGDVFEGLYSSDERLGPGVLTYPDKRQDVGLWQGERLVKLCSSLPGTFTMKEHEEFEYNATEHVLDITVDKSDFQTDRSIVNGIVYPSPEFDYNSQSRVSEDINSLYSDALDRRSSAANREVFEKEFFKDTNEEGIQTVKAWNNTSSCIALQKHTCRHKTRAKSVSFKVDNVISGKRTSFGRKGPLEEASEQLILSAMNGDEDKVSELLVTGKVHVDVADKNGQTALIGAAVNWHHDVINCLLNNGADVNKLNDEGMSALAACHVFFYPIDAFKYNIAERYMEQPPEIEGASMNVDLRGILAHKKKLNEKINGLDEGDVMPSDQDSGLPQSEGVRKMEEGKNVQIASRTSSAASNRSQSNKNGDTDYVKDQDLVNGNNERDSVLDVEEELNLYNTEQSKAMDFASDTTVQNYGIEVTENLIERCATQLSLNEKVVSGRSSRTEDVTMDTARLLAIKKAENSLMENTIRLLLKRGANPNASSVPMPVLFFAIKAADVDAVNLLLLKGADANAKLSDEKGGLAPLHIACAIPGEEGVQITELLLNALANPDVRAKEDDSFLNRTLEEEWTKDTISDFSREMLGGRTPLHIVCARDDNYKFACQVVHLLLDHHANTNVLCNGHSPLSLAIASGNDLAIDELLIYGADPSLPLTHGIGSALCTASSTEYEHRRTPQGRIHLIDKLMRAGADILAPILVGPKRVSGTAVDFAYHMFNLDRRIAHMPYHALTHAERDTYNARRKLLGHIGEILRNKAIDKERMRMDEEEREGNRSASPSSGFVYTGAGAPLPPGARGGKGMKDGQGHVSFNKVTQDSRGERKLLTEGEQGQISGVMTAEEGYLAQVLERRKIRANLRKPLLKYCYECGRSTGVRLSVCTRCKEVYYCSKACKMKAWNSRHKEECVRIGGRSTSPSHKNRVDSPTPATNPDKHKGPISMKTDTKGDKIKVPVHNKSQSAKMARPGGQPTREVKSSGTERPTNQALDELARLKHKYGYVDNYSYN